MTKKLMYEDLKLGEKAIDAYTSGKSLEEIEQTCPIYLNTKEVIYGLNVTDLAIAGILGKIPSFYVGRPGSGKSQLAQDFYNNYFGGNKIEGGKGVFMIGNKDLDIYTDIYRNLDMEKGKWEFNDNVKGQIHFIDEINRCPSLVQNQFLRLLGSYIEDGGVGSPLGEKDYSIGIATANLGNGELPGTFSIDWATWDRMGLVLNFDYDQFKPSKADKKWRKIVRKPDAKTKQAPIRDISDLIINAEKEISKNTIDLGLESEAVRSYLENGLEVCYNKNIGNKNNWPLNCQDCDKNENDDAICSLIRNPQGRILEFLPKYAASLDYLIKLKDPTQQVDAVDLMFKAFELTGAYQMILNPSVLAVNYGGENPNMMEGVVSKLKEDFRKNEDFILTTLEKAKKGEKFNDYFSFEGEFGYDFDKLNKVNKEKVTKAKVTDLDNREVGLGWVDSDANIESQISKNKRKNNGK